MGPIKVVIADDHTLFREGLKRILSLEKDILVVGEASRGDEVTKVVDRARPDVLLLDLKMPKGDVIQTLLELNEKNQAIKTVHSGGLWVDKEISSADAFEEIALSQSGKHGTEPVNEAVKHLTKREVEILRLVAEGLTNEEIGKRIFISEKTVKTHLTNIFDKLKVNNRFKAALFIMNRPSEIASQSLAARGKGRS